MAAPTEYYVDPSLGSDTGDGSVGTPWGRADGQVTQYALDNITRDATDGDRINIKAGTAEVLTGVLDPTTYGASSAAAPLIFQGYTSAAADGGRGELSAGGGNFSIWDSTSLDGVWFVDLKAGNVGTPSHIFGFDNDSVLLRCEIHTSNATSWEVDADARTTIIGCYFHGLNGSAIFAPDDGIITDNFIDMAGVSGTAITIGATSCVAQRNVIKLDQVGAIGISSSSSLNQIDSNSIYNSAAGTAGGIVASAALRITNNLIEGFIGAGGDAIDITGEVWLVAGNAFFNNTANITGTPLLLAEDNEALAASPFVNVTAFQPVDTGNVLSGSWPTADISAAITYYRDKGAVQKVPAAGSGGVAHLVGDGGGLVG